MRTIVRTVRRLFRWPAFYTTMAPTSHAALAADDAAIFAIGHHYALGRPEPSTLALPILVVRFSVTWLIGSASLIAALFWVVVG